MSFEVGTTVGGKFRVDELLSAGATTRVLLAWDLSLGRRVVVKSLNDQVAADVIHRERFLREAQTAAGLTHPHIVKVLERGVHDDIPYFVTEFVPGSTLASTMANQPGQEQLPWPVIDAVLNQIGGALDYAHQQHLVHRDVKPANIIVEMRPSGPHATLIDFGITKNLGAGSSATLIGGFLGTAEYASPEQIQGSQDIDRRSDVYSFGCTAFEVLTGKSPFSDAKDDVSRIAAHLQAPVPRASQVRPSLPPSVDTVFQKALAKDRVHRYDRCTDFVEALHTAVPNETVAHGPRRVVPVPPDVASKRTRNQILVGVAAGVLVLLTILGVWRLTRQNDAIATPTTTIRERRPTTTHRPTTTSSTTTTTTTITTTTTTPTTTTVPVETVPPSVPAPPLNPYGFAPGEPVVVNGSPFATALDQLTTRSPERSGIIPDSPFFWYATWLRHVAPAATDPAVATEKGARFTADQPVSLEEVRFGGVGFAMDAQECTETCQSLQAKLPILPTCDVSASCQRWMTSSSKALVTLRTTVYLRFPAVTQLFDVTSTTPIASVEDPSGVMTYDAATSTIGLHLESEPVPGTVLLVNVKYTDGTSDNLTITF